MALTPFCGAQWIRFDLPRGLRFAAVYNSHILESGGRAR
jgi:hypothetical protein